jgi:hypothetical protein
LIPSIILGFDPTGPTGQSIQNDAGYLSLALIFISFGLIAVLSMRSRTISSFQFELYVFILVVVMAEVPAILINLGFLPALAPYELDGLVVHSISMAFLSTFILWRAFKTFGRKKKSKGPKKVPLEEEQQSPKLLQGSQAERKSG